MSVPATRFGSVWLITPASATPGRLDIARTVGADVAVLDLEDSVPHHRKDAARATAIGYLTEATGGGTTVLGLRPNAPGTVHGA
ncbi:MAG: aldolase/citrate lyase family protein, partial [Pseudonocardiaceae bacterium]